jgi:hypothetical protein
MIRVKSLPPGCEFVIALDPGRAGGWAFGDRELVACGLVEPAKAYPTPSKPGSVPRSVQGQNQLILDWFHKGFGAASGRLSVLYDAADLALVEVPQWQLGDTPDDIRNLCLTAYRGGLMVADTGAKWLWVVHPHDWKRGVPKGIHNTRVLAGMTPRELDLLDRARVAEKLLNNVIDAIGLWKWAKERSDH